MSLPLSPSFSCSHSFSRGPIRVPAHLLEHHSTSLPPFWHTYTKTGFVPLYACHHIWLSSLVRTNRSPSVQNQERENLSYSLAAQVPGTDLAATVEYLKDLNGSRLELFFLFFPCILDILITYIVDFSLHLLNK